MVKEVELSISDKTTVQKMVETGFLVITWVGMVGIVTYIIKAASDKV